MLIKRKLDYEAKNNIIEELELEIWQLGDVEQGKGSGNIQIEFDLAKITEKRNEVISKLENRDESKIDESIHKFVS